MNIEKLILDAIKRNGKATSREIIAQTGLSREYINRHFRKLAAEKKLILVGKANKAHYLSFNKKNLSLAKPTYKHTFKRADLSEDHILKLIKARNNTLKNLRKNENDIFTYAFLEMANNAIEHSKGVNVEIKVTRDTRSVEFRISDNGIGIFNNLIKKNGLKNELEAIQDLLKGKQTTAPENHSGQGIFFTSKTADIFIIESGKKRLTINNELHDIFVRDIPHKKGTTIIFKLNLPSKKDLTEIFRQYSTEDAFDKTQITVELYKADEFFVSRSQARRILHGLDKFKLIVLDFKGIDLAGQAFCDEIFRVFSKNHPEIRIEYENANENVRFMIKRALIN
ncbi:MAG: DUF4325 domain-containing protein [Patescibacteria group bacterium]|nr:DUF4325 domain-containing protein [Patescibacteria group bacterium]